VLLSLITNSRDALLEQGSRTTPAVVDVRVGMGGAPGDPVSTVSIVVRDNGPGIPVDLQGRIFELFFTTKQERGGAGLGLAVSHQIVQAWGGRIDFESVPGSHSEFRVELPLPPAAGIDPSLLVDRTRPTGLS